MSSATDTHWVGTVHLNAVRVASATVTLVVLFAIGRITGVLSGPGWANMSILSVVIMPAGLLLVGLGVILVLRIAGSMGVPFMDGVSGLMSLMMIIFIAVGDPLIWIVRRYYPAIVPVQDFGFVNPHAVMMVQRT